jgi:hypothetical protein
VKTEPAPKICIEPGCDRPTRLNPRRGRRSRCATHEHQRRYARNPDAKRLQRLRVKRWQQLRNAHPKQDVLACIEAEMAETRQRMAARRNGSGS